MRNVGRIVETKMIYIANQCRAGVKGTLQASLGLCACMRAPTPFRFGHCLKEILSNNVYTI